MTSDDDRIVVHGEGGGAAAEDPQGKAAGKVDEFLKGGHRLTEEEKQQKKIKVFSKGQIREFVMKLIDELAAKGQGEQIKEIYRLREELEQARKDAAAEIERLKLAHQKELEDLRKEYNDLIARLKAEQEAELEKIREKAAAEARERLIELEKLVAVERGRAEDLEARLAAALAEIERLQQELAALQKELSGADARTKADLLKLIAQLEARILELELGLDYFDLEEEFDFAAHQQRCDALAQATEGRDALHREAVTAGADGQAAAKKVEHLMKLMHENKAGIGVVVDLVKAIKQAEAARARAGVIEQASS